MLVKNEAQNLHLQRIRLHGVLSERRPDVSFTNYQSEGNTTFTPYCFLPWDLFNEGIAISTI